MKYRLSVRDAAEQDVSDAFDFYEREQPGLGNQFHDEIAEALRLIEKNPLQYPKSEILQLRKAVLRVFHYCIYYSITLNKVVVIVMHNSRRDPARWKRRAR